MAKKPDPFDRLITRFLRLFKPSIWLAFTVYAAGGAAMVVGMMNIWAAAWLHRQPEAIWALVGLGGALVCNAMGARLYYLARDYREYIAIRDKALKVAADVEGFLKPIAEARGRGAEVVGVVIREFGETQVVYDDEPRVLH